MTLHPARRPIEFLVVGHLTVDRRGPKRLLGGAAAYAALTAARLGLQTGIVTSFGARFPFLEALRGVEIHNQPADATTSFENVYEGGRRRQRIHSLASTISAETLQRASERLSADAAVLYAPVARELPSRLTSLSADGPSGLAPQGLLREWDGAGVVRRRDWREAVEALPEIPFVSYSEEDVDDAEAMARACAARTVAVTRGERGATLFVDGVTSTVPAFPVNAVEPTGAGDVFAASFLVATREGRSPREACELACCAASFAVEGDGTSRLASRPELEERLAAYHRLYGESA